jgi:enoyl-CoA hydratase/carnithine racemase
MVYDGLPDVLRVDADGPVRIVTLNDPDTRNAMTDPLHEALTDVWIPIMRDPDVRAAALTGACCRHARSTPTGAG